MARSSTGSGPSRSGVACLRTHLNRPLRLHRTAAMKIRKRPRAREGTAVTCFMTARSCLPVQFPEHFAQAAVQNRCHLINLLRRGHKRRAEGDPVRVEAAQQAVVQGAPADFDSKGHLIAKAFFLGGLRPIPMLSEWPLLSLALPL